jgi:hypothetical protein
MKALKINFPSAIISILVIFICGCNNMSYTGYYNLGDSIENKHLSSDDIEKIGDIVKDVAFYFGFKIDKHYSGPSENYIYSKENKNLIPRLYFNYNGVNANIRLGFHKESGRIGLRDYDNEKETAFIRAIKDELKRRLKDIIDLDKIEFNRLYPFWS